MNLLDARTLGRTRLRWASSTPAILYLFIAVSGILFAQIVLALAHILYLQVITFHPLPHLDEWRTMILFSQVEQDSGSWSLLLGPHAEHRPLLPRLVFLLDARLAHGAGALSLAASDCLLLGLIAIWAVLLMRKAGGNERVRLAAPFVLVLCIASLLSSGHQMVNFIRGFQVAMFMLYFFAMLSFSALALALQPAANGRPMRPALLIFFCCFFGLCASFSMGNGLIVLPILFVMACAKRRELPAGSVLIIAIVAVAAIAAYLAAPGSILGVLGRTDYNLAPGRAVELITFFLEFLGAPWAGIAPNAVGAAGLATLTLSGYAVVGSWQRGRLRSYELVSVAVIVLVLGSAAAVSLARLRFGIEAATDSRYSTSVLMLYAAILVSLWPRVSTTAAVGALKGPTAVQAGALTLVIGCILAYGIASHWKSDYSGFRQAKADAEVAYVANVQDPLPFRYVVPQPQLELAWQARAYVLRHKLSVFSTIAAQSIGRRLTDVFAVADGRCIGRLDRIERTIAGANGGFRIAGWAWDTDTSSVPRAALLVEDGIVKGIGRFIAAQPDVATALPEVHSVKNGFVGYVPRGTAKVTAFVLNRNQTSACRIPGDLALPSG